MATCCAVVGIVRRAAGPVARCPALYEPIDAVAPLPAAGRARQAQQDPPPPCRFPK
jgi:hypothetical protein